jgi:hypothetical protein
MEELREQEDCGDRVAHEHRSEIRREEGVDPSRLHAESSPMVISTNASTMPITTARASRFCAGPGDKLREEADAVPLGTMGPLIEASQANLRAQGSRSGGRPGHGQASCRAHHVHASYILRRRIYRKSASRACHGSRLCGP